MVVLSQVMGMQAFEAAVAVGLEGLAPLPGVSAGLAKGVEATPLDGAACPGRNVFYLCCGSSCSVAHNCNIKYSMLQYVYFDWQ